MAGHSILVMKQIIYLSIFIFSASLCIGQQPGFRKLYSSDITGASFVDIVWDGEKLITTGQFLTPSAPNNALNGLLYMELDTNGNTLFTDIYFHPSDAVTPQIGNSIYKSTNGLVYAMGQILDATSSYLSIYDESERVSTVVVPVDGLQSWLYHCIDWDDNILLSGCRSNYQYKNEGMLIKSDPMGNEIWRRYYGSPGLDCGIQEPYVLDNNTIILPGHKMYWPGTGPITSKWTKTWIVIVDSLGNVKSEWESPKNIENGVSTRLLKLPDGYWLYTTSEFIPMPGQIDDFGDRPKIVCRDSNFNLVWEKHLSDFDDKSTYLIDIMPTSDGNYLAIGKWTWYTVPSICKFSPEGDIIWSFHDPEATVFGGDSYLGGIVELPSGSIVAAGYLEDYANNKAHGLIIKLDKNGCIDTLCGGSIGTYESDLVSKIKIYPNPTSDILTISNPIGDRIEIFDIAGKLVLFASVSEQEQTLGTHDLSAGVYLVKMQEKNIRVTYKIIKK